jgi:hypothetical protein
VYVRNASPRARSMQSPNCLRVSQSYKIFLLPSLLVIFLLSLLRLLQDLMDNLHLTLGQGLPIPRSLQRIQCNTHKRNAMQLDNTIAHSLEHFSDLSIPPFHNRHTEATRIMRRHLHMTRQGGHCQRWTSLVITLGLCGNDDAVA